MPGVEDPSQLPVMGRVAANISQIIDKIEANIAIASGNRIAS